MLWTRLATLGLSALLAAPVFACEENAIEIKSDAGKFRFEIDIADDDLERAQGLMHVEEMATLKGMLFIYDAPLHARFWMKNTLIPLDMLFADETGRIMRIHENATPLSEDTIDGGQDILYVLEINGGLADQFGIEEGAVMKHPAIDQTQAAWACVE